MSIFYGADRQEEGGLAPGPVFWVILPTPRRTPWAVVPRNADGSEGQVKAAAGDTRPKNGAPLAPTNRVGGTLWDQQGPAS